MRRWGSADSRRQAKDDAERLGDGFSLRDWLKQPDRAVTRADLWRVLKLFMTAQREERARNVWYRRLWRWLTTPTIGPQA